MDFNFHWALNATNTLNRKLIHMVFKMSRCKEIVFEGMFIKNEQFIIALCVCRWSNAQLMCSVCAQRQGFIVPAVMCL